MRFTITTLDAQSVVPKLVVLLLPGVVKMTGRHTQTGSVRSAVRKSIGTKQSGRIFTAIDAEKRGEVCEFLDIYHRGDRGHGVRKHKWSITNESEEQICLDLMST